VSGSSAPAPVSVPDELHPRHLLARVAEIAAIIVVVAIAISALPGLDEVRARLVGVAPIWIVAIAVSEVGSCVGYLLVFRSTFCSQMPWRLSYDIAIAEQAANALLPAGGAGGLALGAWALRQGGMPTDHIARRTVAFFVVTSAANFFALVLVGIGVFIGIVAGRDSALLTLVPALITASGILVVAVSPRLLRALGERGAGVGGGRWRARARGALHAGLAAAADGVDQAITLVLGYLIGQLGNLIPVPGGIGATEGALVAVFALYGVKVADATAAVLLYRLFQLVVPALLGAPAFVMLRRQLTRTNQPALVCAPLALDIAKPPAHR
jgi:uncharacterized membrane protein YbhN (UPF0104 family)